MTRAMPVLNTTVIEWTGSRKGPRVTPTPEWKAACLRLTEVLEGRDSDVTKVMVERNLNEPDSIQFESPSGVSTHQESYAPETQLVFLRPPVMSDINLMLRVKLRDMEKKILNGLRVPPEYLKPVNVIQWYVPELKITQWCDPPLNFFDCVRNEIV